MSKTGDPKYNAKRRAKLRKENRCLACAGPKPCNCRRERHRRNQAVIDFCLDCLAVGGYHRPGCIQLKLPVDR